MPTRPKPIFEKGLQRVDPLPGRRAEPCRCPRDPALTIAVTPLWEGWKAWLRSGSPLRGDGARLNDKRSKGFCLQTGLLRAVDCCAVGFLSHSPRTVQMLNPLKPEFVFRCSENPLSFQRPKSPKEAIYP